MAKNKKAKKTHKQKLNPLLKLALGKELKKHIESPEEREKVMQAFAGLDMKTLMNDPEALERVMADPAGELRNFVKEGVDPDADISETAEVSSDVDASDTADVEEVEQAVNDGNTAQQET